MNFLNIIKLTELLSFALLKHVKAENGWRLIKVVQYVNQVDLKLFPLFRKNQLVRTNNCQNNDIQIVFLLKCGIWSIIIYALGYFATYILKLQVEMSTDAFNRATVLVRAIFDLGNELAALHFKRAFINLLFISYEYRNVGAFVKLFFLFANH